MSSEQKEELIDTVVLEIIDDLRFKDRTCLHELLAFVPEENLINYLSEEIQTKFR